MARCKHCKSTYTAVRKGHIFCTETCRKLSHKSKLKAKSDRKKARRIASKLSKLSACSFGKYLLKEVRRAGTVEILQGHTAQSLNELLALRRKCTTASGYKNGEPLGTYELSHVWPVVSPQYLGLLRAENLVIAPREFNRKHGTKHPATGYEGRRIARSSLQPSMLVTDTHDSASLLKLIRSYLGTEFDRWLSGFVISLTQRDKLIKDLTKAGLPKKRLEGLNLHALRSLAEQEEVAFFELDKNAEETREVLHGELLRLGLKGEISEAFERLNDCDDFFGGSAYTFNGTDEDMSEFECALIEQALLCLHGQSYETRILGRPLQEYFNKRAYTHSEVQSSPSGFDDDDIL
ncbi:MAG: hypothetical protein RLZ63_1539 [Pseudomonadota bacterium]|jgi:hypothetical protein